VQRDLAQLRQATGQVVGSVFFGTLMKTMRDSELKGKYGHGGRGEEVFSAQLHGVLAERMGEASSGGVSTALYKHLERQQRLISGRLSRFGDGT
jgi:Rod binding domain-containing protein